MWFSIFDSVFIKVYIFVQQNTWTLWLRQKSHTVLLPDVWFISCNKKLYNPMTSAWVGASQNWPGDRFFKPKKSKFYERLNSNF